jgi:hypothetical protein
LIITWVLKKNANFFAENWEKSQKIVIIASTPGVNVMISENVKGTYVKAIFSLTRDVPGVNVMISENA